MSSFYFGGEAILPKFGALKVCRGTHVRVLVELHSILQDESKGRITLLCTANGMNMDSAGPVPIYQRLVTPQI